MATIKITAKRQATFPKELCNEMGLKPGDRLEVEAVDHGGKRTWVLRPIREADLSFFGCLRAYATGRDYDMDEVRDSIIRARRDRDLD